ncbi:MAG: 50S ribosomal protein L25/general stress protein Ctc [Bacteroidota bacterium]
MKSIEIKVQLRDSVGKKSTKNLRKNEFVPCVIYGTEENINFFGHENNFKKIVQTPFVYIVKLDFGDKKYDAILKDIQFHPVTDRIIHIDFMKVTEDVPVKIAIPVILEGLPVGVKDGGKLSLENRRISVKGLLKNLPDNLVVDVENLELGKVVKVKDLSFENLEITTPPNTVIASVKLTRAAKGMEAETTETEEVAVEGTPEKTEEVKQ